jgi:hypothetical protein
VSIDTLGMGRLSTRLGCNVGSDDRFKGRSFEPAGQLLSDHTVSEIDVM